MEYNIHVIEQKDMLFYLWLNKGKMYDFYDLQITTIKNFTIAM